MKNEKGMGLIQLIVFVVLIILIVAMSIYFVRMQYSKAQIETIKTDMLQVQWKLKDYIDTQTVEGDEIQYLGSKVSDNLQDPLLSEVISNNVIPESEYEKYYILKDEDLASAGLGITNYEGSYFLINYETYEIIITQGCNISDNETLFKLSDIESRTEDNGNNQVENNQVENEQIENVQTENQE